MPETDQLDLYLAQEAVRPFDWSATGNGDCQLFVAGWAERIGWPDAGADWRGRYACELEARMLIEARGGLVAVWCGLFGPPRMGGNAERGDIGLFKIDGWHIGAISTGREWMLRAGVKGVRALRRAPDVIWDLRFKTCRKH